MKTNPSLRVLFALSGCGLLVATQANAATYYWDSNGATSGLGDTAGIWGTTAAWGSMNGGSGRIIINGTQTTANTAIAAADTVYFGTVNMALGSTGSTISIVGTGVQANRIVFGAGQGTQGITLSGGGGAITLSNASASIVANNTGTNTIGAVLNGTTGLLYGGSGTTVLTGANGFTGGVIVTNGGTLQIGDGTSGSLTSQALTFNNGGGVFHVRAAAAGSTQAMGALTFSTTGIGEGTVRSTYGTSGNAEVSFSSLVARGAGATGNFIVSGGSNGTTNKIVLTGAATGFLDKGLYFNGSSYAAYDAAGFVRGLIYGSDTNAAATDTITASSHVQLTSSPTSRAGDTLLSLNLAGGGVNYTMDSGSLTVPAILKSGGGTLSTISGGTSLTTAGNAELVIRTDTSSDLLNISTSVTGFSGGLTKTGAGTLTLSGSNGYTGATRINAGILALSGGSAIADNQSVILANAAGATLQLNNHETILDVTGGGLSGGNVNVQGNTLTLSSNASYTFSGQFTGTGSGAVIKQGAGTLTLSNKNTFAGSFTLQGGAVEFNYGNDGTGTLIPLSSGGAFNMANGTTLRFNATSNLAWGTFGAQLQAANGGSPTYPYGWVFANHINIDSGTANIRTTGNENAVRFTGNVTGGSSGSQTLAFFSGGISTGSGDRQSNTFAGIIQDGSGGTLGVSIDFFGASGTSQAAFVNLSGQNTFTGPLVVTNSKGLVTGATTGGYVAIGGEMHSSASTFVTGTGYLGGGNYTNTISLATGTTLVYLSSANQILGGGISGGGIVRHQGTGVLTLSGSNSYTGGTTVSQGTLVFRNTGAKSGTGTHAFAAGTTLGLGVGGTGFFSSTDITNAFAGTMTGNLSGITVTTTTNVGIDTTAGDFTHSADITGTSKGLTKLGANSLTLSGANTYTGATTVSAGTLIVNGSLGNTAVTVNGGAFGGTGSIGSVLTITSGSFHVADINDALQVTGAVTLYAGFGVDDLTGITWGSVADGTYTLIDGTLGAGVFAGLANNSLLTAYDIGGGRSAYFQEGSLQLVVIPEPRALLLGSLGILLLLRRRR